MKILFTKEKLYNKELLKGISIIILFLFNNQSYSQDPIFSQYFNAPLQVNPAFAGNSEYAVLHLNYRNEWPALPNAYRTYAFSYDQYFDRYNSGFGMTVLSDNAGNGILNTTNLNLIYSYKLRLFGQTQMKFGIEVGARQYKLDWNKLIFLDQLDPKILTSGGSYLPSVEIAPANLESINFDLSVGMLFFNENYYGGLSMKHINTPRDDFKDSTINNYTGLPIRWTIHVGGQINFDSNNNKDGSAFLSPNIMLIRQADLLQLNIGTLVGFRRFFTGFWLRRATNNSDALITTVGVRKGYFRISYSFDFTISKLSIGNTGGSHELGITLNFGAGKRMKSEINNCFEIFL